MADWVKDKPEVKNKYEVFVNSHKAEIKKFAFYPWHARYAQRIIVLRKKDLKYIDTLNIRPPRATEEKVIFKP